MSLACTSIVIRAASTRRDKLLSSPRTSRVNSASCWMLTYNMHTNQQSVLSTAELISVTAAMCNFRDIVKKLEGRAADMIEMWACMLEM